MNQNISLRPNWIWRAVVAVVVIRPAEALGDVPENAVAFGFPKFVWFSRLKHSARNWSRVRSARAKFLNRDMSSSVSAGPLNTPRPRSPHVPGVGRMNAFGLYHRDGLPVTMGSVKPGFREGRSGLRM